jgi:type IV pilus assembly protein PilA
MHRTFSSQPRAKRRGFTLIELLVVVLILAILMAVALPLYLSAIADAQKKTCRANMQTIANTVQSARVKNNSADYSAFIGAVTLVLEPDLQALPICPNGGAYTIVDGSSLPAKSSFKVNCSIALHGHFEPGVDSN